MFEKPAVPAGRVECFVPKANIIRILVNLCLFLYNLTFLYMKGRGGEVVSLLLLLSYNFYRRQLSRSILINIPKTEKQKLTVFYVNMTNIYIYSYAILRNLEKSVLYYMNVDCNIYKYFQLMMCFEFFTLLCLFYFLFALAAII